MKKLIAIFLVCLMIVSMVACGKKAADPNGTQPQSSDNSQAGSADATEGATGNDAGASAESTAPGEDATEPSQAPAQDANKVEPTPTTPSKGETDKDEDIKVEIDNGDNNTGSNDQPVVTPPDDNSNSNFVIDFDDLLEASKK